jgi:hypothetical protein
MSDRVALALTVDGDVGGKGNDVSRSITRSEHLRPGNRSKTVENERQCVCGDLFGLSGDIARDERPKQVARGNDKVGEI